jgi:hypothetical protein
MNAISLASRAGAALDAMIPDSNRDKIIARLFGVSVRMAQYLRCGKCWTVERLSTATEILGEEFTNRVWESVLEPPTTDELLMRFDRLERQVEELLTEMRRGQGRWTTRED